MPYSDKGKQREAIKKAMQRKRVSQEGITKAVAVIPENVIPEGLHPIVEKLIDPKWRAKIWKVVMSLEARGLSDKVYVGYPGMGGISVVDVKGYLGATE